MLQCKFSCTNTIQGDYIQFFRLLQGLFVIYTTPAAVPARPMMQAATAYVCKWLLSHVLCCTRMDMRLADTCKIIGAVSFANRSYAQTRIAPKITLFTSLIDDKKLFKPVFIADTNGFINNIISPISNTPATG